MTEKRSEPWSLGRALSAVNKFTEGVNKRVEDVNGHMEGALARQKALSAPRLAFHTEKIVINSGMQHAERQLSIDAFRKQSVVHQSSYDEAYARFAAVLKNVDSAHRDAVVVPPFVAPGPHPIREIDASIRREFEVLATERASFFADVREKLGRDPRIAAFVREHLEEHGWLRCWDAISKPGFS